MYTNSKTSTNGITDLQQTGSSAPEQSASTTEGS